MEKPDTEQRAYHQSSSNYRQGKLSSISVPTLPPEIPNNTHTLHHDSFLNACRTTYHPCKPQPHIRLTMLRMQMTREGFPCNSAPTRFASPAAASGTAALPPLIRPAATLLGAASALTIMPPRRSVFCATNGVVMPCRDRPRPSPGFGTRV